MAHSSISPSHSKKTQTVHFRATLQTAEIELVAKIRTLHQHNIELSIKRRSYNTQGVTVLFVLVLLQTKDLKCATYLLSEKFRNMSEEKKIIVRDLGFGGLMHIPPLRVYHQILRELANSFKLGENKLKTGYGSFKIRPKTIGAALGINASDDKQIFRRFQGKTLKNLKNKMMVIAIDNEQDRLMFKRIFILYIQMVFLLPTTINKISHVHLTPIFKMDTITKRNWGGHVLTFIIKGITNYNLKKKKAIDGCLFALMIIYFHLSKNKDKKRAERPPEPWIANWTKEQLVERMKAKIEEHMASSTSSSDTETTQSDHSTSESETEEDSEDSTRKQPTRKAKKCILFIKLDNGVQKKRKKIKEDSDSESKSTDKTQSKKKKVVVEDSSPKQAQSYHGYSTLSEIETEDLDEFLMENNEKSVAEGLSLVEESASEAVEENMMVMREETPSEVLAIVPIQVCLPLSQTTTTPETENEPTPLLQIEETTKSTPEPPNNLKNAHPRFHQLHLKCNNPALEEAAALMMMARTASYVPRTDPMPSFSLGLTYSSQEETATVSTKEKSPQIPKESEAESFEKFETPARTNENSSDMKEKCYLWAIQVKTDADGLQAQDIYTLSKVHLASLAPETHIEVEIVSAMCFILNQKKIPRFQEEVYCLPSDIVNMAIVNHPKWVFLNAKTNRPFRVENYPMFIPFLNVKKLASHRYGYYILGAPLKTRDKDKEIEPPHLNISGQKTSYDCAIYVMKWLEILNLANINRRKYEWENRSQDEVDHFRVEYASRILFHDMNLDKAEAIRGSNIDYEDIDTD
ncbi:hypothetical protein Ahy_A03g011823 [Arachis hypogaea]|uniref:Ubiquitin-like protease family profile domain-containing protein n=1 Tax=Arachis hypogaea TaxID=3818 RepID=A0A445DS06_ARAHY|nr:hypothetical protein Ahy_A03g011823 [Arachis hypogaea]